MTDATRMLSRKEVCRLLGVSDKWLRSSPTAPAYVVFGTRKHLYRQQDIKAWLAARTVNPAERRAA